MTLQNKLDKLKVYEQEVFKSISANTPTLAADVSDSTDSCASNMVLPTK